MVQLRYPSHMGISPTRAGQGVSVVNYFERSYNATIGTEYNTVDVNNVSAICWEHIKHLGLLLAISLLTCFKLLGRVSDFYVPTIYLRNYAYDSRLLHKIQAFFYFVVVRRRAIFTHFLQGSFNWHVVPCVNEYGLREQITLLRTYLNTHI